MWHSNGVVFLVLIALRRAGLFISPLVPFSFPAVAKDEVNRVANNVKCCSNDENLSPLSDCLLEYGQLETVALSCLMYNLY
jgi:hypothetical protein